MSWKFEKEFRKDKPETIGETDSWSDLDKYKDWLEQKLSTLQSEKADLVEMLEFVNKEISKYKYDHKIVGHLGKCQFKIEQLLTKHKKDGI